VRHAGVFDVIFSFHKGDVMNPVARKIVVATALLLTPNSNVAGAVITFTSSTLLPAVDGNG
jgi:hypothetical protein